jgi:hypothetical protein
MGPEEGGVSLNFGPRWLEYRLRCQCPTLKPQLIRSVRMRISLRQLPRMRLLLLGAFAVVLPLRGEDNDGGDHRSGAKDRIATVLYEGPLVHDQDWTIKSGPVGPDNQKFRAVGGTCSMIPSDLHNAPGSGFERVTFEAKRNHLNIWGDGDDGYRLRHCE